MEIRVLSAEEVRQALPMPAAIEAMKQAFGQLSRGEAILPLRSRIEIEGNFSLFMPAYLEGSGDLAVKIVSVFPDNPDQGLPTIHAAVMVLASSTGEPIALMEGASLTAIRTGAASGAATDLLARPETSTAAIFGSGVQARTQLEAVCTVREIKQVRVYSLDQPGAQAFVEEMAGMGPVPRDLRIASSPAEAIGGADVICTATTSSNPVFVGSEVSPGTHINAVGSFTPSMQEIDSETVRRSLVVVDSRQAVLAEAGDLIIPIQRGEIEEDWVKVELGEIVNGSHPGRTNADQITLFKTVGIAVQDAAAAAYALNGAMVEGLGSIVNL